jgi:hypothetical protein
MLAATVASHIAHLSLDHGTALQEVLSDPWKVYEGKTQTMAGRGCCCEVQTGPPGVHEDPVTAPLLPTAAKTSDEDKHLSGTLRLCHALMYAGGQFLDNRLETCGISSQPCNYDIIGSFAAASSPH